jgi:hypothetical protein
MRNYVLHRYKWTTSNFLQHGFVYARDCYGIDATSGSVRHIQFESLVQSAFQLLGGVRALRGQLTLRVLSSGYGIA